MKTRDIIQDNEIIRLEIMSKLCHLFNSQHINILYTVHIMYNNSEYNNVWPI